MFCITRQLCLKSISYAPNNKKWQVGVTTGLRQHSTNPSMAKEQTQSNNKGTTFTKSVIFGTCVGGLFGVLLSLYDNYKMKNLDSAYKQFPPKVLTSLPDVRVTKRFFNANDPFGLEVVLFQFQTCPFCCKVRAFLDFMGISYTVVEVDAVLRQDIKWSSSKKVPTVLMRQKNTKWVQVNDSSAIISLLSTFLNAPGNEDIVKLANYYPTISYVDGNKVRREDIINKYFLMYKEHVPNNRSKDEMELERQWRIWVDNHLVHLISPNCYRTFNEALETFKWFSDAGEWDKHFPSWERNVMVYVGAIAMWTIAKMLKHRHGLSDDVRSHIYTSLDKWSAELKKRKSDFCGGKKPNLADLAVFGVLCSMEGCQAFKDCLQNTDIGDWFFRTKHYVERNRAKSV